MIKRKVVGRRHNEKSLVGQFFEQISIGNMRCGAHQSATQKVNDSAGRIITAARVDSVAAGRIGSEHPISMQAFPVSDDARDETG